MNRDKKIGMLDDDILVTIAILLARVHAVIACDGHKGAKVINNTCKARLLPVVAYFCTCSS